MTDLLGQFRLQSLQLGQTVGVGLDLGLGLLSLLELGGVLLGLAHQDAHLLAEGVALGAQVLSLGNGGTVLAVQLQHLVHQGKLLILELLLECFPLPRRGFPGQT